MLSACPLASKILHGPSLRSRKQIVRFHSATELSAYNQVTIHFRHNLPLPPPPQFHFCQFDLARGCEVHFCYFRHFCWSDRNTGPLEPHYDLPIVHAGQPHGSRDGRDMALLAGWAWVASEPVELEVVGSVEGSRWEGWMVILCPLINNFVHVILLHLK